MSRITRDRIEPGDTLQSSDLNTRYSDYTQTDLNANNVTDAAFGHDQVPTDAVLINMVQGTIGGGNIAHTSGTGVYNNATSGPATRNIIVNNVATVPSTGWTLSSGTTIRVYFNLQAKSELSGANPHTSSFMGSVLIEDPLTPATIASFNIGAHCWLVQLQWNITSSALLSADFVDVPGAGDFQSVWTASKYGEQVDNMAGVAAMPAMWAGSVGWYPGTGGKAQASKRDTRGNGWRNISGAWVYEGTGQTVYGFRVVVHGVYHPYNDGTDNGLVLETAFTTGQVKFRHSVGNIMAMHMRSS